MECFVYRLKIGLLFIALSLTSQFCKAETCVTTASEFEQKKDQLPKIFQNLPVMLTTDSWLLTAGLEIRTVGPKIKLEGHVWKPSEIYSDDSYVKKICYDGTNFNVTLENGKSYDVKIKSEGVSISGFSFEKSSASTFAGIVEKVKKAQSRSNTTVDNSANGAR
ncbi:hypothetical protein [Bdellovibrio sp.]|uniref:hypothetical protein n=1 Tax=Bdellovibrio sp. TaxID=28201 RepID=UPI0039E217F7